jgi:diacylglycerol kinase (ATP)
MHRCSSLALEAQGEAAHGRVNGMSSSPVPVIVNPASGPDRPVLHILSRAFRAAGADWDIYLTKRTGDAADIATRLARQGSSLIAVCGGDGTLKEVAASLAGADVDLAILPGGTGNAMAVELGIPLDLAQAVALACAEPRNTRAVDLGCIGQHRFILRASMGFETELLQGTDRRVKNQLGFLAYPLTALQKIGHMSPAHYSITVDGSTHEAEGVQCTIANSAQMGFAGMALAQGASVNDGQLDVIVLTSVDFLALASIATSNVVQEDLGAEIQHWHGREIGVTAEPKQAIAIGGDVIGHTPVQAHVIPAAVRVVVPLPGPQREIPSVRPFGTV